MASIAGHPPQDGRHGYVVLPANTEGVDGETGLPVRDFEHYLVVRECPFCHQRSQVKVPSQGLWKWEHGEFVQNAFPDLNAGQREQVMSGIHPACWDDAFEDDD